MNDSASAFDLDPRVSPAVTPALTSHDVGYAPCAN